MKKHTTTFSFFALIASFLIALPAFAQTPLFEIQPSARSSIKNPAAGVRSVQKVGLRNTNTSMFSVSLNKQTLTALSTSVDSDMRTRRISSERQIEVTKGPLLNDKGQSVGDFVLTQVVQGDRSAIQALFRLAAEGTHFGLQPDEAGEYELREYNHDTMPNCGHNDHKQDSSAAQAALRAISPLSDTTVATKLDILVMYSPEASEAAGGELAMAALTQQAINLSNESYLNSEVPLQLNLVHSAQTEQSESGSYQDDLLRMQAQGDGYFDEAHTLRDQYGADLVVFLVAPGAYCGLGFAPNTVNSLYSGSLAFSVVSTSCINYYSFQHEIGHNLGLQHDVDNAPTKVAFEGSYGSRWIGDSGTTFRSVMAYSPGIRIPYFSNPDLSYDGQRTGTAGTEQNAFTLMRVASIAADYRASIGDSSEEGEESGSEPSEETPESGTPKNLKLDSLTVTKNQSRRFTEFRVTALNANGVPIPEQEVSVELVTKNGSRALETLRTDTNGETSFKDKRKKKTRKLTIRANGSLSSLVPAVTTKNKKRRSRS